MHSIGHMMYLFIGFLEVTLNCNLQLDKTMLKINNKTTRSDGVVGEICLAEWNLGRLLFTNTSTQ